MSITEFLIWLANSGGNIVVISNLIEKWPWYQTQTPEIKRNLFFVFSALVTMAAYCVLTYVDPEILKTIAPFFQMFYVTFSTIYLGTAFHKQTKAS